MARSACRAQDLESHIAFDIGAADITRRLAERLEARAILTRFSRLLIDANRGDDDPTLVMRISDGRIIPGNARIDRSEIDVRRRLYWQPYRDAIAEMIAAMSAQRPLPAVISLHTFTPRVARRAAAMAGRCALGQRRAVGAPADGGARRRRAAWSATTNLTTARCVATRFMIRSRGAASPACLSRHGRISSIRKARPMLLQIVSWIS